jgi:prevent-host-death family protein
VAWSLHDAKNRLSQLVREAQDAPQVIAVRGEERAVVLSLDAYRRLAHRDEHGLRAFLRASPWAEVELELERVTDPPRDVDLTEENETQSGDSGAIDPATEP